MKFEWGKKYIFDKSPSTPIILCIDSKNHEFVDENGDNCRPYAINFKHLIEYVEPKPKVKMAPALIKSIADSKRYYVTSDLYASKDAAMNSHDKFFVKWLIDTPYAIEVDA